MFVQGHFKIKVIVLSLLRDRIRTISLNPLWDLQEPMLKCQV